MEYVMVFYSCKFSARNTKLICIYAWSKGKSEFCNIQTQHRFSNLNFPPGNEFCIVQLGFTFDNYGSYIQLDNRSVVHVSTLVESLP